MSRPNPEPTNRTPARVSCRIVSSRASEPPSQAWLLAVLTTSKPARASATAAAGGAANMPAESSAAVRAGPIWASRLPDRRSRSRSIRIAVENLDASPEQGPRLRVGDARKLGLGAGNVEPAQRHYDDVGRERGQLVPGTGSRRLAGRAGDVLTPGEAHQLGNPVARAGR